MSNDKKEYIPEVVKEDEEKSISNAADKLIEQVLLKQKEYKTKGYDFDNNLAFMVAIGSVIASKLERIAKAMETPQQVRYK